MNPVATQSKCKVCQGNKYVTSPIEYSITNSLPSAQTIHWSNLCKCPSSKYSDMSGCLDKYVLPAAISQVLQAYSFAQTPIESGCYQNRSKCYTLRHCMGSSTVSCTSSCSYIPW